MADYAIHDTTLTGIANVIRKKDGTSALIDPADYADRINLMGMLEEKTTASASIAHIEDGASEVPIKNWLVTLPASLSGYTEVNGKQAKKNFLNDSIRGHNGANIYFAHDTGSQNDFAVRLRAGTYTFSVVTADGTVTNLYVKNSDTDTNITGFPAYNSLSKTFTLDEDTNCAVYVYKSGYTDVTDILTAQIEYGNTATSYEAYEAPTQYTASLGRTIYGGQADIVTGEGSETWYKPNMASLTMRGNGISREGNLIRVYINEVLYGSNTYEIGLCNSLTFQSSYTAVNNNDHSIAFSSADGNQFLIREDSLSTATKEEVFDFVHGLTVVYPLATPTDFTFTPITPTPETENVCNFWADEGDSSVTYRAVDTVQPIPPVPPTLISKTVTENGTYEAEDDDADGYDEVTVNVPPYSFMPAWTETKLVDNTSLGSSITFSEDYHNYQMLRFVIYNSSTQIYDSIFVLPSGIDKAFTYSSNKFCLNQQITGYTNQYVTYQEDSLLEWSRTGNRNCNVYEVYGMTFTNATLTTEVIYSRDAIANTNVTPTPPTGKTFFDYDAIIYMCCTSDTNITHFCKWWITKPKLSLFTDSVGYGIPLFAYNAGKPVVFTETSIGTYGFFYVVGLNFTAT